MTKKILIIEDDANLTKFLRLHLERADYEVDVESRGADGLARALQTKYAAVILDGMLPDIDGLEVLSGIREQNRILPILMLTARSQELDRVVGLEAGADDYVTKPFQLAELVARVNALVRRHEAVQELLAAPPDVDDVVLGDLRIETPSRRAFVRGQEIELTTMEFDLLVFLVSSPNTAFSREDILKEVWQSTTSAYENSLYTIVNRLRAKIELDPKNPQLIETVRGIGYRFCSKN